MPLELQKGSKMVGDGKGHRLNEDLIKVEYTTCAGVRLPAYQRKDQQVIPIRVLHATIFSEFELVDVEYVIEQTVETYPMRPRQVRAYNIWLTVNLHTEFGKGFTTKTRSKIVASDKSCNVITTEECQKIKNMIRSRVEQKKKIKSLSDSVKRVSVNSGNAKPDCGVVNYSDSGQGSTDSSDTSPSRKVKTKKQNGQRKTNSADNDKRSSHRRHSRSSSNHSYSRSDRSHSRNYRSRSRRSSESYTSCSSLSRSNSSRSRSRSRRTKRYKSKRYRSRYSRSASVSTRRSSSRSSNDTYSKSRDRSRRSRSRSYARSRSRRSYDRYDRRSSSYNRRTPSRSDSKTRDETNDYGRRTHHHRYYYGSYRSWERDSHNTLYTSRNGRRSHDDSRRDYSGERNISNNYHRPHYDYYQHRRFPRSDTDSDERQNDKLSSYPTYSEKHRKASHDTKEASTSEGNSKHKSRKVKKKKKKKKEMRKFKGKPVQSKEKDKSETETKRSVSPQEATDVKVKEPEVGESPKSPVLDETDDERKTTNVHEENSQAQSVNLNSAEIKVKSEPMEMEESGGENISEFFGPRPPVKQHVVRKLTKLSSPSSSDTSSSESSERHESAPTTTSEDESTLQMLRALPANGPTSESSSDNEAADKNETDEISPFKAKGKFKPTTSAILPNPVPAVPRDVVSLDINRPTYAVNMPILFTPYMLYPGPAGTQTNMPGSHLQQFAAFKPVAVQQNQRLAHVPPSSTCVAAPQSLDLPNLDQSNNGFTENANNNNKSFIGAAEMSSMSSKQSNNLKTIDHLTNHVNAHSTKVQHTTSSDCSFPAVNTPGFQDSSEKFRSASPQFRNRLHSIVNTFTKQSTKFDDVLPARARDEDVSDYRWRFDKNNHSDREEQLHAPTYHQYSYLGQKKHRLWLHRSSSNRKDFCNNVFDQDSKVEAPHQEVEENLAKLISIIRNTTSTGSGTDDRQKKMERKQSFHFDLEDISDAPLEFSDDEITNTGKIHADQLVDEHVSMEWPFSETEGSRWGSDVFRALWNAFEEKANEIITRSSPRLLNKDLETARRNSVESSSSKTDDTESLAQRPAEDNDPQLKVNSTVNTNLPTGLETPVNPVCECVAFPVSSTSVALVSTSGTEPTFQLTTTASTGNTSKETSTPQPIMRQSWKKKLLEKAIVDTVQSINTVPTPCANSDQTSQRAKDQSKTIPDESMQSVSVKETEASKKTTKTAPTRGRKKRPDKKFEKRVMLRRRAKVNSELTVGDGEVQKTVGDVETPKTSESCGPILKDICNTDATERGKDALPRKHDKSLEETNHNVSEKFAQNLATEHETPCVSGSVDEENVITTETNSSPTPEIVDHEQLLETNCQPISDVQSTGSSNLEPMLCDANDNRPEIYTDKEPIDATAIFRSANSDGTNNECNNSKLEARAKAFNSDNNGKEFNTLNTNSSKVAENGENSGDDRAVTDKKNGNIASDNRMEAVKNLSTFDKVVLKSSVDKLDKAFVDRSGDLNDPGQKQHSNNIKVAVQHQQPLETNSGVLGTNQVKVITSVSGNIQNSIKPSKNFQSSEANAEKLGSKQDVLNPTVMLNDFAKTYKLDDLSRPLPRRKPLPSISSDEEEVQTKEESETVSNISREAVEEDQDPEEEDCVFLSVLSNKFNLKETVLDGNSPNPPKVAKQLGNGIVKQEIASPTDVFQREKVKVQPRKKEVKDLHPDESSAKRQKLDKHTTNMNPHFSQTGELQERALKFPMVITNESNSNKSKVSLGSSFLPQNPLNTISFPPQRDFNTTGHDTERIGEYNPEPHFPLSHDTTTGIATTESSKHHIPTIGSVSSGIHYHGILEVDMLVPFRYIKGVRSFGLQPSKYRKRRIAYMQTQLSCNEPLAKPLPQRAGVTQLRVRDVAFVIGISPQQLYTHLIFSKIPMYPPLEFFRDIYCRIYGREISQEVRLEKELGPMEDPNLDKMLHMEDFLKVILPDFYDKHFGIKSNQLPNFVSVKTYQPINFIDDNITEMFSTSFSYNMLLMESDAELKPKVLRKGVPQKRKQRSVPNSIEQSKKGKTGELVKVQIASISPPPTMSQNSVHPINSPSINLATQPVVNISTPRLYNPASLPALESVHNQSKVCAGLSQPLPSYSPSLITSMGQNQNRALPSYPGVNLLSGHTAPMTIRFTMNTLPHGQSMVNNHIHHGLSLMAPHNHQQRLGTPVNLTQHHVALPNNQYLVRLMNQQDSQQTVVRSETPSQRTPITLGFDRSIGCNSPSLGAKFVSGNVDHLDDANSSQITREYHEILQQIETSENGPKFQQTASVNGNSNGNNNVVTLPFVTADNPPLHPSSTLSNCYPDSKTSRSNFRDVEIPSDLQVATNYGFEGVKGDIAISSVFSLNPSESHKDELKTTSEYLSSANLRTSGEETDTAQESSDTNSVGAKIKSIVQSIQHADEICPDNGTELSKPKRRYSRRTRGAVKATELKTVVKKLSTRVKDKS